MSSRTPVQAVLVCAHGPCTPAAGVTLDALRPLVATTPRALLVRTGCLDPGSGCPVRTAATAGVCLQLCDEDLRPLGLGRTVAGSTTAAIYRSVQSWFDGPAASQA